VRYLRQWSHSPVLSVIASRSDSPLTPSPGYLRPALRFPMSRGWNQDGADRVPERNATRQRDHAGPLSAGQCYPAHVLHASTRHGSLAPQRRRGKDLSITVRLLTWHSSDVPDPDPIARSPSTGHLRWCDSSGVIRCQQSHYCSAFRFRLVPVDVSPRRCRGAGCLGSQRAITPCPDWLAANSSQRTSSRPVGVSDKRPSTPHEAGSP